MISRIIIVGGGIAGLAAAKALSGLAQEVVLLEGIPPAQGEHLHVLLKTGQEALERIFPGILNKLEKGGCPLIDWSEDTHWENSAGVFPRYPSPIKIYSMGRTFLNSLLRDEVSALPNVTLKKMLAVDFDFEGKTVTTSSGEEISGDYIILAAGSNFPLKRFLKMKTKAQSINLTYRSAVFKTCDLKMNEFKQYYFQIDPPLSNIGGVICPIENGKTIVTLIEKESGLSTCKGIDEFKQKGRLIPNENFYHIIKDAIPLSDVKTFRKNQTRRNYFAFRELPPALVILGDLHSSLNPVFGQGMCLALRQVELLKDEMQKDFSPLRFHLKIQRLIRFPFLLSLMGSNETGLLKSALRLLMKACQKHRKLHGHFLNSLHSLGPT